MRRSIIMLCAASVILGACGGRRANPVSTVSVTDQQMTCAEIHGTLMSNDQRMAALREEERRAKSSNVAIGVVGAVLFWPALFALDTTNTEQVEISALQSRSAYLTTLAAQRRCGAPGAPEPSSPDAFSTPAQSPVPGRSPAPAANAFQRCQMSDGSVSMLSQADCSSVGGRAL